MLFIEFSLTSKSGCNKNTCITNDKLICLNIHNLHRGKKKERNGRQYFDIGIKIKTIHFTKSFNDSLYSTFHGDKTNLEQFIYLCLIYKGHVIKYLWTI